MKPQSLYIHIPFCIRKCLFCSFVVAIGQEHRSDDYVQALIKEMQKHRGANLHTIYLGGGTPSMLSEEQLRRLMGAIVENFTLAADCEMTIEANPEGISPSKVQCLRELGFNRVSLGVQTMQERYLKFLGRNHDGEMAKQAYRLLQEGGFSNINVDLMYAFPGQSLQELESDVRTIASLGSSHMSLYTLTIEPNSRFYAKHMKLDDEEKIAQHYLLIGRILYEYGFHQYEVSNFSKPGFESKHNFNYWQGGEYIALGVGAHGYLNGRRYWNIDRLQDYLAQIETKGEAIDAGEDLSEDTKAMEKVLFGLRTNRGIAIASVPPSKRALIDDLVKAGLLSLEDNTLKATDQGRLVLDEISVRLI